MDLSHIYKIIGHLMFQKKCNPDSSHFRLMIEDNSSSKLRRSNSTLSKVNLPASILDISRTELIIPNTLHGQTITAIGEQAFDNLGLTSVSLPSSLNGDAERPILYRVFNVENGMNVFAGK